MIAKTSKGKEIRDYFIQIENGMRRLRREVESGRVRMSAASSDEEKDPKKRRLTKDEIALETMRLQVELRKMDRPDIRAQNEAKAREIEFQSKTQMMRMQVGLMREFTPGGQLAPKDIAVFVDRTRDFGTPQAIMPPAIPQPVKYITITQVAREMGAKRAHGEQERMWRLQKITAVFRKYAKKEMPKKFCEDDRELLENGITQWEDVLSKIDYMNKYGLRPLGGFNSMFWECQ